MVQKVSCALFLSFTLSGWAFAAGSNQKAVDALKDSLVDLYGDKAESVAESIFNASEQRLNQAKGVVRILKTIKENPVAPREDAIAIAIVVDRSSSMDSRPRNSAETKSETAKASTNLMLDQLRTAAEKSKKPLIVGVFDFDNSVKKVLPMSNMQREYPEYNPRRMGGGTAIGDAMLEAKKALSKVAARRNHMIVITDGENRSGVDPDDVMVAFNQLTAEEYPVVHFVAFDIEAKVFRRLRKHLYGIFEASSESELNAILKTIVDEEILAEKPYGL